MTEIWKDIKEYEGKYKISSLGNIYSTHIDGVKTFEIIKSGFYKGFSGTIRDIGTISNDSCKVKAFRVLVEADHLPNVLVRIEQYKLHVARKPE